MPAWSGFARLAAKTGYRADELGTCVQELCSLHAHAAAVADLHNPCAVSTAPSLRSAGSRVGCSTWRLVSRGDFLA